MSTIATIPSKAMPTSARSFVIFLTPLLILLTYLPLSALSVDRWFLNHAVFMTVGVLSIATPSILIRQIKGRLPTKIHGIMMVVACVSMIFAWYVIHGIKNVNQKPHLTTYHGKFGATVVILLVILTVGSIPFFEPDWRLQGPTAERIRSALKQPHKWGGRIWLVAATGVLISGFIKKLDGGPFIWAWGAGVVITVVLVLRTGLKQLLSRELTKSV